MIKKFWKVFLASFFALAILGFGFFAWHGKNQEVAVAQNLDSPTRVVCEEPIPIGIAIDNTIDLLDQVYQAYKGTSITAAKERMTELVKVINEKGEGKVCDFNGECLAKVYPAGGDLSVIAKPIPLLKGQKKYSLGTNIPPICQVMGDPAVNRVDCVGNPCPSLSQFTKNPNFIGPLLPSDLPLENLQEALMAQAENVHALFDGQTKEVPKELANAGETPGKTKISQADFVRRYIDYIDKGWLTPSPAGNACVLSKLERERVAQGTMGDKFPKSCLNALQDGTYSPKPWSEECIEECASGDLSDECRACLAECEGSSVFATINCKLYSTQDNKKCAIVNGASEHCCGNECINGLNSDCYDCLCPKSDKNGATPEQCLDWVCGGNQSNWVCCHEEQIRNPIYYVADDLTEPDAIGLTRSGSGYPMKTQISAYTDNIKPTASGLKVQYGIMASATSTPDGYMNLPFGTCIKVTSVAGNSGPVRDFADERVIYSEGNKQYFCVADRGGEHIKSGERLDLWLDKNDTSYYTNNFANDWGVRESNVELWYDPSNPCATGNWSNKKLVLGACEEAPPTPEQVAQGVKAGDLKRFKMGYGKGNQFDDDASSPLKDLFECMDKKMRTDTPETDARVALPEGQFAMISSISDSAGIELCGDASTYSKPPCAHTSANSCHYGGTQGRKVTEGSTILDPLNLIRHLKSVAADISFARSSEGAALKAAQAAVFCGCEGGYQVSAIKESDHYHISVAVKKGTLGYSIGKLTDIGGSNYYDCDKAFRESEGNVVSCPK